MHLSFIEMCMIRRMTAVFIGNIHISEGDVSICTGLIYITKKKTDVKTRILLIAAMHTTV
jgi:hypothetical protein